MTATKTPSPVNPRAYAVEALIAPRPQSFQYSRVSKSCLVSPSVEGERAGTLCAATGPRASARVASELPTSNPSRTPPQRRVPARAPRLGSQDPVTRSTSLYCWNTELTPVVPAASFARGLGNAGLTDYHIAATPGAARDVLKRGSPFLGRIGPPAVASLAEPRGSVRPDR
jgi:hypothetical protein